MTDKTKGPVMEVHGVSTRGRPSNILAQIKEECVIEVLLWRERNIEHQRHVNALQGTIDKAEATIRNQDVELRRLRARIAELESR